MKFCLRNKLSSDQEEEQLIDQIFTLRQIAEKYVEFWKDHLYVCYVDFRKAFDCVWRDGLLVVMWHLGYPEKIVRILEDLYSETLSAVRVVT